MNTPYTLKLNSLISLTIGGMYQHEIMDKIKDLLVANHGVNLKLQHQSEVKTKITCLKTPTCQYCVQFRAQFRADRLHKKVFILKSVDFRHQKGCRDYSEAMYLKKHYFLQQSTQTIIRIMRLRIQSGRNNDPPTKILNLFLAQENKCLNYLQLHIHDADDLRRIKKKFDNIVAEGRKRLKSQGILKADRQAPGQMEIQQIKSNLCTPEKEYSQKQYLQSTKPKRIQRRTRHQYNGEESQWSQIEY